MGHPPRLQHWDYSAPGAYFVTFVTGGRRCCLAEIIDGQVALAPSGAIVRRVWERDICGAFASITLDELVIMPNHVHAIIFLASSLTGTERLSGAVRQQSTAAAFRPLMAERREVLGKVIRFWKAKSCAIIRRECDVSFAWQTRFYDHVIRGEAGLAALREYVSNNPMRWADDPDNPHNVV